MTTNKVQQDGHELMAQSPDTLPFGPLEWLIAGRYLRPRRKEGFISIIAIFSFLGIMLGVMTLIVVMAVMNWFRHELYNKLLGLNGHFTVSKFTGPFTDYDDIAKRLLAVPAVKSAMPLIEGQALFTNAVAPGTSVAVYVRGMRAADIMQLQSQLQTGGLRGGSFDGFDDSGTIALGLRLANSLGVNVGDSVKLITTRGKSTVFGIKPNSKIYSVSALFEVGMSQFDNSIAFLPLAEAQTFFEYPGQANFVEVKVDDPERVKAMTPAIRAAVGDKFTVNDWMMRDQSFFTVLDVERNTMFMILSLIVLVATLNIISGLMMLVKDKGRDVAILRTMGASQGSIMRIFLITGASIGVAGTLAGFLLGIFICANIENIRATVSWMTNTVVFDPNVYLITRLPAQMNPYETGAIVVTSFLLAVAATLYPSWRASRLDPVEALRYE